MLRCPYPPAMDRPALGEIEIAAGLFVRRIGFGGAWLTGPGMYGPPENPDGARRNLRRAVEAGVQLIDTADCYGPEISERLVCDALRPYPADVAISTKGGRIALGDNIWRADGRPDHLRQACEASLGRLGVDTIDLYQLNAIDPEVAVEESLGALVELRDVGKIRAIGVCNVSVPEFDRVRRAAPVVSVQNRYDLLTRQNEEVLTACERENITFLPWFPPNNGLRAAPGSPLARVADAHGATPAQIALAWLSRHSPVILPLPGTATPEWWDEDLAALDLELTSSEVEDLGESEPHRLQV